MPAKCAVCDNVNKLFSSEEASRLKRNAFDLGRRRTQAHDIDTAIGPPVFFQVGITVRKPLLLGKR